MLRYGVKERTSLQTLASRYYKNFVIIPTLQIPQYGHDRRVKCPENRHLVITKGRARLLKQSYPVGKEFLVSKETVVLRQIGRAHV